MTTVGSTTGTNTSTTTGNSKSLDNMTSDDFLKLLISQLSNQDPMEPVKNQDLMQQLSAIRTLESNTALSQNINNMSTSMTDMATSLAGVSNGQQVVTAMSLVGKVVTGTDTAGAAVQGKVDSIVLDSTGIKLQIGTHQMDMNNVTQVGLETANATA